MNIPKAPQKMADGAFLLLCVILGLLALALALKIIVMKKTTREISQQITEKLDSDTNTLIDISSVDRDMQRLAAGLNIRLRQLRRDRLMFLRGDLELKNAVTSISHDLRTPLTAICGYMDLLEKCETSDEVRGYLKQIENRAEHMRQLTEELFRYSVVTSEQERNPERLCLNDVLEESIAAFYAAIKERGITPEINITEKRIEVIADRSALLRIFSNIISNMLKYSSGDFFVTMDDSGEVTFKNSSERLDKLSVDRLFDRFYTVETGDNSTGLGLSIAKLLAEQNGGNLSARIEDNKLVISLKLSKTI